MKITKKVLTEAIIKEADEENKETPTEEAEKVVVDNIDAESPKELAKEITAGIEAASNGELTISPEEAQETAQDLQQAADDLNTDTVVIEPTEEAIDDNIVIESELTSTLDDCLATARKDVRLQRVSHANILISGLPGSGKTAGVKAWAKDRGLNLFELNAKDPDIEVAINGLNVRDMQDGIKNEVTKAYSRVLAPLDRENSVLFLDEYNRQTNDQLRGSLLQLINEKKIVGEDNGIHVFKNLLFTIAAINPACQEDQGAARLNSAEISRFNGGYLEKYDSDPETTKRFIMAQYPKIIKRLNKQDPDYKTDFENFLRIIDLGLFICNHEDFEYDSEEKLSPLYLQQKKMLNQRALIEMLENCDGNVLRVKSYIEKRSGFLDDTKQMLLDILEEYREPTFEELCDIYSDYVTFAGQKEETPKAEVDINGGSTGSSEQGIEDDEDEDMWGNAENSKNTTKSAAQTASDIRNLQW